ncbi:MAG: glycogen/starch synthase [Tissierellia bacterium]|nr:glycogen/starch synthase [Tissierellia bacterium]MDD3226161.1 glycogen/starch synthase [Tissierellia bacterium]MDD3751373.1 glycogen/starch synthase [Tissierellia bacterium]MDD4045514.1 glycogen/starch synthase [Tissierellia bacterium]MDD4677865.1 glycogen/starch synthase [Tissierellia bacterium]
MNKLKVLYVASEAAPFMATGGLGEVAGSLPKALAEKYKNKIDIRIILPLYQGIVDRSEFEFIGKTSVPLAWRQQYCGIYKTTLNDITYYFIDNEYYFKRSECYGHFDDAERFAFFSKAILYILPMIKFMPNIIHANDWQTSLVPIYLATKYFGYEGYRDIKSIITIHNIEYQGVFDLAISEDVFDLHGKEKGIIEFKGAINLLKGSLETADIISTVSESYSKEIYDDYYAHGLAEIIQKNSYKIRGILNGIDTEKYNPEDDEEIFENYSAESIQKKNLNKKNLQSLSGLPQDKDVPVIGIISRLVKHKGFDLIQSSIEEILKEKVQFIILGKGDRGYELYFKYLQESYHDKIFVRIGFDSDFAKKIYSGADLFLMPSISEPCGIAQMISSRYGTVPIVRETGGLKDSIKDASLGKGNGFTFSEQTPQALCEAVKRALKVFENKEDWEKLVETVMKVDFSWRKSAEKYFDMYSSLANIEENNNEGL